MKQILGPLSLVLFFTLSAILFSFYKHAEKKLKAATRNLRELGEQYIYYTAQIEDSIPLESTISIKGQVPINLLMQLNDSIPIDMLIHYRDSLSIPVNIGIDKLIHVDTTIDLRQPLSAQVKTTLPLDQKIKITSLAGLQLHIRADVPIDKIIPVNLANPLWVATDVRVQMAIAENIPVKLDLTIPVKTKIGLSLAIKNEAIVSFPALIPVRGKLPVKLKVPVIIPLRETPIRKYLDSTAGNLEDLLRLN